MSEKASRVAGRDFVFESTPAVAASRARPQYIDCSVCGSDNGEYLFHRVGVRFVRCRSCGLVYVSPVGAPARNYFDLATFGQHDAPRDRANAIRDFTAVLERAGEDYSRKMGAPPKKTLWIGRFLPELLEQPAARAMGLVAAVVDDARFEALARGADLGWIETEIRRLAPDMVVLDELLESTSLPGAIVERVAAGIGPKTWVVVNYANAQSMPARILRRYWPKFFDHKHCFLSTNNLIELMSRHGMSIREQFAYPSEVTLSYALDRIAPEASPALRTLAAPVGSVRLPARTGNRIAIFSAIEHPRAKREKLSIVFPCFNEARYVASVIETILGKELPIERELIIVESNSTDGTRDIVRGFENRPGVRVVYEDEPKGKGHAVRTGLKAVSGTIVLIQDADFEYDIDDYDALLAPILQHKTAFVLGSRSLGLDDWKVRRFDGTPARRFLLNIAQVGFAKTFNVLYQQRATDVNTMYKVFRSECLDGIELESDRFSLDIELVCKLVKNGYSPLEVPVNYVARGFEEGKKISFVRDALPSYAAFFKYRFGD